MINYKMIRSAEKALKKAVKKRAKRKTPYPFGFEYRSERKWILKNILDVNVENIMECIIINEIVKDVKRKLLIGEK